MTRSSFVGALACLIAALPSLAAQEAGDKKSADPFESLKSRLKKHEDEIVKLRAAMLKEIADEEAKITELIKKEEASFKGGDRAALSRAAQLRSKKMQLGSLKFGLESRIRVGVRRTPPLTEEQRLGIHVGVLNATVVKQLNLAKNQGVVIDRIDANSPAAKVGLQAHDILLKIDGKDVSSDRRELRNLLAELKTDVPFAVELLRAGKRETIKGLTIPAVAP